MAHACLLHYYPSAATKVLLRFPHPAATLTVRPSIPWPFHSSRMKRNRVFSAKLNKEEDDEPFFRDAMERASIRYLETLRPDPLFLDPYIGCLSIPDIQTETDMNHGLRKHCLATKFIDDKLLSTIDKTDGLRQVVLLTDGMDTRPYRLNWPASTIVYDVSPETIFKRSKQKLEDVGAKIPRSCLSLHVPYEFSNFQQSLISKGFNGARPSLWALQGLPIRTLTDFKDILSAVSSLAMKGCLFFGELPIWLVETETANNLSVTRRWVDKLFMSHGLRVEMIEYGIVARSCEEESTADDYKNILFVAEQLQYSDDQMEIWRREFQRIEEEADEDGFEEL